MSILLFSTDLMFASSLSGAARAVGQPLVEVTSAERLLEKATAESEAVVLLDLASPQVNPAEVVPQLKALATPPKAVLAFGPHVHDEKLRAAAEAGCDQVFTRGQMHAQAVAILNAACS